MMKKKKLALGDLKVSSFITSLNQDIQKTLLGRAGEDTTRVSGDQTRVLTCPSNQDPFACDSVADEECNEFMTDNKDCQEFLN